MTPHLNELSGRRSIEMKCTVDNGGKFHGIVRRHVIWQANGRENGRTMNIKLKDVQ